MKKLQVNNFFVPIFLLTTSMEHSVALRLERTHVSLGVGKSCSDSISDERNVVAKSNMWLKIEKITYVQILLKPSRGNQEFLLRRLQDWLDHNTQFAVFRQRKNFLQAIKRYHNSYTENNSRWDIFQHERRKNKLPDNGSTINSHTLLIVSTSIHVCSHKPMGSKEPEALRVRSL